MPKDTSREPAGCSNCFKVVQRKSLDRHMDVHDPKTLNKYCGHLFCPFVTRQSGNLKVHIRTVHNGVYPPPPASSMEGRSVSHANVGRSPSETNLAGLHAVQNEHELALKEIKADVAVMSSLMNGLLKAHSKREKVLRRRTRATDQVNTAPNHVTDSSHPFAHQRACTPAVIAPQPRTAISPILTLNHAPPLISLTASSFSPESSISPALLTPTTDCWTRRPFTPNMPLHTPVQDAPLSLHLDPTSYYLPPSPDVNLPYSAQGDNWGFNSDYNQQQLYPGTYIPHL